MANPRPQRSYSTPNLLSRLESSTESQANEQKTLSVEQNLSRSNSRDILMSSSLLFSSHRSNITRSSSPFFTTKVSPENLPIPNLPVLDAIYDSVQNKEHTPNFENYVFVCGQHLLSTTVSLMKWIMDLGGKGENIFIVGKSYSNNSEVIDWLNKLGIQHTPTSEQDALGKFVDAYEDDVRDMWTKASDRMRKLSYLEGVIVLDDGGHVLAKMPKKTRKISKFVIGIEQTSSGIASAQSTQYSTIQVASSLIKGLVEPPMIAEIVADKLMEKLSTIQEGQLELDLTEKDQSEISRTKMVDYFAKKKSSDETICYGIVGYGHIGQAVLMRLIANGNKDFIIFDADNTKLASIHELEKAHNVTIVPIKELNNINNADIIIGCTGKDITANKDEMFKAIRSPKILISCSSKDSEFHTLLSYIQSAHRGITFNPLSDRLFKNGFGNPLLVVKGGMPINFDGSHRSVPVHDIQVIRGLKAQAILQGYEMIQAWRKANDVPTPKSYKLTVKGQLEVFQEWIKDPKATKKYWEPFKEMLTEDYISKHSVGDEYISSMPSAASTSAVSYRLR
ncbi:MAG: NAD(P)-binding domain-containing protein [Gammaproteobacteria bacterium]|nr:NAD(P)-binding domain-containing protein [Gammaproteobacteria bacterium]